LFAAGFVAGFVAVGGLVGLGSAPPHPPTKRYYCYRYCLFVLLALLLPLAWLCPPTTRYYCLFAAALVARNMIASSLLKIFNLFSIYFIPNLP
jgi:hypothetical protein